MAVSMRLKRMGNRNNAFYRLVVADARSPRDGRFIEELGWYDPYKELEQEKVELNKERVLYWLGQGASPSTTVKSLLKKQGVEL